MKRFWLNRNEHCCNHSIMQIREQQFSSSRTRKFLFGNCPLWEFECNCRNRKHMFEKTISASLQNQEIYFYFLTRYLLLLFNGYTLYVFFLWIKFIILSVEIDVEHIICSLIFVITELSGIKPKFRGQNHALKNICISINDYYNFWRPETWTGNKLII